MGGGGGGQKGMADLHLGGGGQEEGIVMKDTQSKIKWGGGANYATACYPW